MANLSYFLALALHMDRPIPRVIHSWTAIYTTNIDDALENALRRTSPQTINVRYRDGNVEDQDFLYRTCQIVKLNGSVDRLEDGVVFSPREYGSAANEFPPWYEELANDFFRFRFAFIGTKLKEPLFYHAIERHRGQDSQSPKSHVITPAATPIERAALTDLNLEHIEGTLSDFVSSIGEEFQTPLPPIEIAKARRPELKAVLDEVSESTREETIEILRHVAVVSPTTLPLEPGNKNRRKDSRLLSRLQTDMG